MGTTYMHAVTSLDGYIAGEDDNPGPLFDWYFSGDQPIVDDEHFPFRVSAASAEYVRSVWSSQEVIVLGRHLFDLTNGWEGRPTPCDRAVVVSHRPKPEGWHPEASYDFVTSVEDAIARAHDVAGDKGIAVTAGAVGGQAFALGLIDYVAIDVVPVVFGRGKSYFGSFADGPSMLGQPDVVIQGEGVLHLRFPVRR